MFCPIRNDISFWHIDSNFWHADGFFYIIVSFTLACPAAQTKFLRNSISSSLHLFSTMPTYFNQKLWVVCRHMVPSTDPGIFNVWRKFALFCVGGWFG